MYIYTKQIIDTTNTEPIIIINFIAIFTIFEPLFKIYFMALIIEVFINITFSIYN